jgi:hypothetical protein
VEKAMLEKRSITINGTGAVNQIKELAKELQAKTPILKKVSYFYGPNAATNIPVLSPGLATPAAAAEGATSIAVDNTAVLSSKTITPHSHISILPISLEALTLGTVDLENELPQIFADAFSRKFHKEILTGSGSGLSFKGIFTNILPENLIPCSAAGDPTIADLVALALEIQDMTDDGVIIIAPSVYARILADTTAGVADVYKEELIRNKKIENVDIILTSSAPSSLAPGSVVAVAGRLEDYGLGIASEVMIEPIKKVGDINTYFQANIFANGTVIVDKNFFGLKTISE